MIKRFDGANWIDTSLHRRWDGANWVNCGSIKKWNGNDWVECMMTRDMFINGLIKISAYIKHAEMTPSSSYEIGPISPQITESGIGNKITATCSKDPNGNTTEAFVEIGFLCRLNNGMVIDIESAMEQYNMCVDTEGSCNIYSGSSTHTSGRYGSVQWGAVYRSEMTSSTVSSGLSLRQNNSESANIYISCRHYSDNIGDMFVRINYMKIVLKDKSTGYVINFPNYNRGGYSLAFD